MPKLRGSVPLIPYKYVLRYFACTGAIGIQNCFWPLIILFEAPTCALSELKQRYASLPDCPKDGRAGFII